MTAYPVAEFDTLMTVYHVSEFEVSPGFNRVDDVLYYDLPVKIANKVKECKENLKNNCFSKYAAISAESLKLRHKMKSFNTFDEAIEFIDNLGDIDNLMEVASVNYQIHTIGRPDSIYAGYTRDLNSAKCNNVHYIKDVFNKSKLLESRLKSTASYIGTTYKVILVYLGYA